jgi:tripartite-type tricarboxylate transporter receptor subunit TctC
MKLLRVAAACALLWGGSAVASAQVYPSRPITMVVPFAAGGPVDTVARILSEPMRASLGQSIIVENVTGAAGSIGVGRVARAAPDGYTLSIGHWSTHVVNGAIYPLPYDLLRDLEPIVLPSNPMIVVSKNAVPAKSLDEFVGWIKANEGKVSAGTAGAGSATHVAGVYFQNVTGTRFQFVPYRGTGPALQDLVAGQIDFIVDQASNSLQHVRDGKIRAYAPKGTPKDIIAKLNGAAVQALSDPLVRQRFGELGLDIPPRDQLTPEALGAFQKAEIEKWWPVIKGANIKTE